MLSLVKQAYDEAKKYPTTKEGMLSAIKNVGGKEVLSRGLDYLNNSKVQSTLNQFGVDTNQLKNLGNSLLSEQDNKTTYISDIKNRLSKL